MTIIPQFIDAFLLQTLADIRHLFYGGKRPAKRGKRFNGAEQKPLMRSDLCL